MLNYNSLDCLASSAELPDSDDTPVDNELQILISNLLLAILVVDCILSEIPIACVTT